MTVIPVTDAGDWLGNRALLDKVDKLRALGISSQVPLPQMVVVGDQSSGKSSVLESLTGFQFPRSVTLCTRHATEIICRREETTSVIISIVPHNATPEREKRAKEFRRVMTIVNPEDIAKIYEDAATVMGIQFASEEIGRQGSAFSKDVLRVELNGPEAAHLTVIDVPGMFENETPGVTTKSDIELVKNMVKGYIREPRTIILAVVPCTADIANQKILTMAAEADPEGKRTLGVLTKPDLAVENATKGVVVDLVQGKRRDVQLGYCVVRNRGADDMSSATEHRNQQEKDFFAEAPWSTLPADRVGICALRIRIKHLLMDRTRCEFPKVRSEMTTRLRESQQLLAAMGQSRETTDQQRAYLGRVASKFTMLKNYGLDARYTRNEVFADNPDLKLITRIREINERFSKVLHDKGHTRSFNKDGAVSSDEEEEEAEYDEDESSCDGFDDSQRNDLYNKKISFTIPSQDEDELNGILSEPYCCSEPENGDIMEHIEHEYLTSRGYELGTFGSEMVPSTFKEQSKKWSPLTRGHTSNAILIVHHFIRSLLEKSCPDVTIREELWAFLLDGLLKRYQRAMDHAEFLLEVEFQGKSITYNPAFEKAFAAAKSNNPDSSELKGIGKQLRSDQRAPDAAIPQMPYGALLEFIDALTAKRESSIEATRRDIHAVLRAFYNIARTRFVDVVCQQVVDHFLLQASNGPLGVLSDEVVLGMTTEQLETIAGEDMATRAKRDRLTDEIDSFTQGLKILRG